MPQAPETFKLWVGVGIRPGLTRNVLIISFAVDHLHDQQIGTRSGVPALTTWSVENEQH